MGDDAHTASFFPGADTLAAAIDPRTDADLITARAPAAGEPRITFTIGPLIGADALFLHIEGAARKPCSMRRGNLAIPWSVRSAPSCCTAHARSTCCGALTEILP